MNTYVVKYIDGVDLKVAYIQSEYQTRAKEIFLKDFSKIDADKILSIVDINTESVDYGAALAMAQLLSFFGWLVIIGSIIAIIIAIKEGGSAGLMVSLPILGLTLAGLTLVVFGQTSRATLDNANNSKQMLDLTISKKV